MSGLVDITLPSGEQATVPQADLAQALAAGATARTAPAPSAGEDDGGLLGKIAAGVLGAGSAATLGATDKLAREIPYILGGPDASRKVTEQLRLVRERNPYSTMAGEFGGLLLNPEALAGAGEVAAAPIAARFGEGLLGKAATSAARLGTETALMGAQHEITEESLGDHDLNAQAIWSQAAKEGMLGTVGGGVLGLGGGLLGKARGSLGLLARRSGPLSGAALDEIAGAEGAGTGVRDHAARAESAIDSLRATGATRDQAVDMVQELEQTAKGRPVATRVSIDPATLDAGLYENPEAARAIMPDGSTDYAKVTKRVPFSEIDVPPVWDETKLPPIRSAREAGVELDPIKIGRMSDDEPWNVVDGIHRSRVAIERGESDILARYEIETKPQRLNDNVHDLSGGAGPKSVPLRFDGPTPGASQPAATIAEAVPPVTAKVAQHEAGNLVDQAAEKYIQRVASENPERAAILRRHYQDTLKPIEAATSAVDRTALDMSATGTSMLRNVDDVANEAQFVMRNERFSKLVDPTKLDAQMDQVARVMQDADGMLTFWETTEAKGGAPGAIKAIRRQWNDVSDVLHNFSESPGENLSRDLNVKMNRFKQNLDRYVPYGRAPGLIREGGGRAMFGVPEAIMGPSVEGLGASNVSELADKVRAGLEDEAVWGEAGAAQARENLSFSEMKARFDDFRSTYGVNIDQSKGVRIPEIDYSSVRSVLDKITGNAEVDEALQPIKSARRTIDGMRSRINALLETGELTEGQAAKLAQGKRDVASFEASLNGAMKEAAVANRVKAAVLEEGQTGMGGLLGAGLDVVNRPLATMRRLAQIRHTTDKVRSGAEATFKAIFDGSGSSTEGVAARVAESRPREKIIEEMQAIRAMSSNPAALEQAAARMVGDLSSYAPKIADGIRLTALRALIHLALEAPQASVSTTGTLGTPKARYSDIQLHDWETKRNAAFNPADVLQDMKHGRLNRDAITTAKTVAPQMFAEMQNMAREQIDKMAARGELDNMPYQQKSVIASLLEVPADRTFEPDFMAMLQAAKAQPTTPQGGPRRGGGGGGPSKPPAFMQTEAQRIEGGGF